MRELKRETGNDAHDMASRTPPGVRELKRGRHQRPLAHHACRTPPGVRELKQAIYVG